MEKEHLLPKLNSVDLQFPLSILQTLLLEFLKRANHNLEASYRLQVKSSLSQRSTIPSIKLLERWSNRVLLMWAVWVALWLEVVLEVESVWPWWEGWVRSEAGGNAGDTIVALLKAVLDD
jgi:hypothetical protein